VSPHQYGPHDPTQGPDSITVGRPGRYQGREVVPIHPAIVRQREAINTHAHKEARRDQ
jgi:hypothetical protein